MGFWRRLVSKFRKRRIQLIVCGLDGAGKSTIVNKLKPSPQQSDVIVPTVGFQAANFQRSGISFRVFDMSGSGRYREMWTHQLKGCHAVVFVIDSSDKERLSVVKEEVERLVKSKDAKGIPVLFFANKMDIPGALSAYDCLETLDIRSVVNSSFRVV
eukprot:TRINITY_DN2482_c0_g1_i2.p1 TRINITY_DN2482_c0_g1~~TRINITY_DN2482_c0_g1_i2.p1  ORF type:complete len:157 (+),score=31.43 TRINITY_DN2482_c0_g1_i2:149-619(+)